MQEISILHEVLGVKGLKVLMATVTHTYHHSENCSSKTIEVQGIF